MKKIVVVVCVGFILSSCTWVRVTSQGEGVRLVQSAKAVEPCKKIGKVNTKVVSEVVFNRDAEKVAGELADLARNEAATLGGDTIVPTSEIIDGRRSYDVYQCFPSKR
ncbi:MAG TPA: DUF4156 domain-containing protein [Nitrosomonas sp.]|jgi:hypothetical protein|nr:DUF4156 domain-containing protein [Nitrosomonas sp.]HRB97068.1 DUF4156 domain-containing protein [Nitrosomonas sp.]